MEEYIITEKTTVTDTRSRTRFFIALLCVGITAAAVSTAVYYGVRYHQLQEQLSGLQSKDNSSSGNLKIITRKEWFAQPMVHAPEILTHPTPYVVITHTATDGCETQRTCIYFVQTIQEFHIVSRRWWDIGYNFLVGGDGNVYEGRGWDGRSATAPKYNSAAVGIAFIGNFSLIIPPSKQITSGKALIAEGVRLGKISKDYKLLAHRQVSKTDSPGIAFFEEIKKWDHWAQVPQEL